MRYPLFLDVRRRRVVVVGGGAVAVRRCRTLVDAGADVVVIAPEVSTELPAAVTVVRREFAPVDLDGAWLALACTDDAGVNAAVAAAAELRGIWTSRADDATQSPAWIPAGGAVDDVQVAVTAGGDPGRARALRDDAVRALQSGEWRARRTRSGQGRVILVGGGPGDPGLLTLRGYRALLDADVVVADRLGPTELVGTLPADVEVVDVGKNPRGVAAAQDDINQLLVDRARAGQVVVRLKGGDPFVLGRGAEEVAACAAAGITVDVVPGVSSVTAAATLAGVPLTRRGTAQEFTVASGHVPPGDPRSTVDWEALGAGRGTLVLLMAVAHLGAIAGALRAGGRDPATPVVIIENASLPNQRFVRGTLGDIADVATRAAVEPPAVVVIGEVVDDLVVTSPPDAAAEPPSG
ncbi:MAG: uroporphyrin-III C-methyltransferase / precorrin-2 dehydrogenase / sirohydrochlorin ferrochelatase [Frankiaceae bacterium]|nr:uroporphyrin-III C-methyltransferase / precorrin-2 dehydrogenase / sirohydrochlorin ferrochelatase [Frankiaceae bacterium]